MKKNRQLVVDNVKGDCFRACITSILELPNDSKLPNCDDPEWLTKWYRFLYPFGITLSFEHKACWRSGYWIASVPSKNFVNNTSEKDIHVPAVTHAIVMKAHKVVWDPSTKKRYRVGESLLGKDLVQGGYFLEVLDPSKLKRISL